jgi:hypothetical protein
VRPHGPIELKTQRRNRGSGLSNKPDEGKDEYDENSDDEEEQTKGAPRGSGFTTSLGGVVGDVHNMIDGFKDINCALSTASLWCRQVVRVSLQRLLLSSR